MSPLNTRSEERPPRPPSPLLKTKTPCTTTTHTTASSALYASVLLPSSTRCVTESSVLTPLSEQGKERLSGPPSPLLTLTDALNPHLEHPPPEHGKRRAADEHAAALEHLLHCCVQPAEILERARQGRAA